MPTQQDAGRYRSFQPADWCRTALPAPSGDHCQDVNRVLSAANRNNARPKPHKAKGIDTCGLPNANLQGETSDLLNHRLGVWYEGTQCQDAVPDPRGDPRPFASPGSGPGGIDRAGFPRESQDGDGLEESRPSPFPANRHTRSHCQGGEQKPVLQGMVPAPETKRMSPPTAAGTSKAQDGMPILTEESGRPITRKPVPGSGCQVPESLAQLPGRGRGRTGCPGAGRRRGPPDRRPP